MTAARVSAVVVAALLCAAATLALVLGSDHPDADTGWGAAGPSWA